MKERVQAGLKLYTLLEAGRVEEFSKWLRKHSHSSQIIEGINEGCGPFKCSVLLRAVSMPNVKWEDIMLLIDRFKADVMRKDLNRWTVLHWAAHGDTASTARKLIHRYDQVKQLLNQQACANDAGDSALMVAAKADNFTTFHALLDAGADPLVMNGQGKFVLDILQEKNRMEDIRQVLRCCVNKDRVFLIDAASEGHWDIVTRVLDRLDNRVTIEQKGKNGETLLNVATCEGKADVVETLLKRNTDPNIGDEKGYTPLFCSVDSTSSADCTRLLLRHNADVTLLDKSDCTVFHHIAYEGHLDILKVMKECVAPEVLRSIIDAPCGARTLHSPVLSRRVTLQGSALHIAALMGKYQCIPLLVEFGADIYCQDAKGRTVIEIILDERSSDSSRNNPDLDKVLALLYTLDPTWQQAKRLMEVNFDPDFRCDDGETLLHMACKSSDSPRTIRLFLDHLASPSLLDNKNNPPLFYAITSHGNRSLEVIQLLLDYDAHVVFQNKHGYGQNMVMAALLHGNVAAAKVLMESKSTVAREDLESRRISSMEIMTMIIKGFVKPLQFIKETVKLSYFDALFLAEETVALSDIRKHNSGVLRYNCGDIQESVDVTPLQLACLCGNTEIVRFLQQCGIDIAETNSNGETAMNLMRTYSNLSHQKVKDVIVILDQASDIEQDSLNGSSFYLDGNAVMEPQQPRDSFYGQRDKTVTQSLQEIRNIKGNPEMNIRKAVTHRVQHQPKRTESDQHHIGRPTGHSISNTHSSRPSSIQRQISVKEIQPGMIWAQVRDCLENGANPNFLNEQSNTPLHWFCEQGTSVKIVELLLQYGANPNALNDKKQTPITQAVVSKGPKSKDIIGLLLEYGATIEVEIHLSKTKPNPFRISIENQLTDIAKMLYMHNPNALKTYLENHPFTLEFIHSLVFHSNIAMLELLAKDIGLSFMKQYLETNVAYAIPSTLTEDIPLATLLEEPSNQQQGRKTVSFAQDLMCPGSSLHLAALQCNGPLLRCLIDIGVSTDSRDSRGRTPLQLMHACTLFFTDQAKAKLPEILLILDAHSNAPTLPFQSSMLSLDDLDDVSSVFGTLSRAQSSMNVSNAKTVAQVQYGIRSSLIECFKQTNALFENIPEINNSRHKLIDIQSRARAEVETYLSLLSSSGDAIQNKSVSRELLDTCGQTTRDIDRLIQQTNEHNKATNSATNTGSAFEADYITAERYVVPVATRNTRGSGNVKTSTSSSHQSHDFGTTRSAPPYVARPSLPESLSQTSDCAKTSTSSVKNMASLTTTKGSHDNKAATVSGASDAAIKNMHSPASPNAHKTTVSAAYDDVISYELFGLIATRMDERQCGWEGLVEELAAGQGREVRERIKEDIATNHNGDKDISRGLVYEALILWKLYTPDATERSKRLRRALDALGMSDLGDELVHVMRGQGQTN